MGKQGHLSTTSKRFEALHPADGECPVLTSRRGGLKPIVQKAPGPSRTKASPTPKCSTKFIGTSWRGGFPEWNHKTIAASAAPGAVTAPPLQTFRF
jgi:hypothetical protein